MKQNVRLALEDAEEKDAKGLLVWNEIFDNDSDEDYEDWWSSPEGDRETLYSLASLYSSENIGGEGTYDEVLKALKEAYPEHIDK